MRRPAIVLVPARARNSLPAADDLSRGAKGLVLARAIAALPLLLTPCPERGGLAILLLPARAFNQVPAHSCRETGKARAILRVPKRPSRACPRPSFPVHPGRWRPIMSCRKARRRLPPPSFALYKGREEGQSRSASNGHGHDAFLHSTPRQFVASFPLANHPGLCHGWIVTMQIVRLRPAPCGPFRVLPPGGFLPGLGPFDSPSGPFFLLSPHDRIRAHRVQRRDRQG